MKRTKYSKKLIQIKHKHLKAFREKQWLAQNKICPILKQEISLTEAVFDHMHITKKEIENNLIGQSGKGLLRGVIHNGCNVVEGKIVNSFVRTGLRNIIDIPTFLRNLADYLENPPLVAKFIHPNEVKKVTKKKLGIRLQKKVYKYWKILHPKRKLPKIPKAGKVTKEWQIYINEVEEYLNKGK